VSVRGSWLERSPARDALWRIPGVVGIGFGWKERNGEVLAEWAIRVHVERKRPLGELVPEDRIPSEIDGLQTDVVVAAAATNACAKTALHPGMQITPDVSNAKDKSGTIGCLVKKGGNLHILTNYHILIPEGGLAKMEEVYQPEKNSCSDPVAFTPKPQDSAGFLCYEMRPTGGKTYWLDCGLTKVVPGTGCENKVPGGSLAAGIRDLSVEASQPVPDQPNALQPATLVTVHKVGATTGASDGVVTQLCYQEQGGPVVWELFIKSTRGRSYTKEYDIHPSVDLNGVIELFSKESIKAQRVGDPTDPDNRRLLFTGVLGTDRGDSGSVWYDDQKRVVGLNYALFERPVKIASGAEEPIPTGSARACIAPVFEVLGLPAQSSIVTGVLKTAGERLVVPGEPIGAAVGREAILANLSRVEAEILSQPGGRRLLDVFREHYPELSTLVHHRRRVTVAWHRGKGPAFVAAGMIALRDNADGIPEQVSGQRLVDTLRAMHAALRLEASPQLSSLLGIVAEPLISTVARSTRFEDVLAAIRELPRLDAMGHS
jgi:hypothetical protein